MDLTPDVAHGHGKLLIGRRREPQSLMVNAEHNPRASLPSRELYASLLAVDVEQDIIAYPFPGAPERKPESAPKIPGAHRVRDNPSLPGIRRLVGKRWWSQWTRTARCCRLTAFWSLTSGRLRRRAAPLRARWERLPGRANPRRVPYSHCFRFPAAPAPARPRVTVTWRSRAIGGGAPRQRPTGRIP